MSVILQIRRRKASTHERNHQATLDCQHTSHCTHVGLAVMSLTVHKHYAERLTLCWDLLRERVRKVSARFGKKRIYNTYSVIFYTGCFGVFGMIMFCSVH